MACTGRSAPSASAVGVDLSRTDCARASERASGRPGANRRSARLDSRRCERSLLARPQDGPYEFTAGVTLYNRTRELRRRPYAIATLSSPTRPLATASSSTSFTAAHTSWICASHSESSSTWAPPRTFARVKRVSRVPAIATSRARRHGRACARARAGRACRARTHVGHEVYIAVNLVDGRAHAVLDYHSSGDALGGLGRRPQQRAQLAEADVGVQRRRGQKIVFDHRALVHARAVAAHGHLMRPEGLREGFDLGGPQHALQVHLLEQRVRGQLCAALVLVERGEYAAALRARRREDGTRGGLRERRLLLGLVLLESIPIAVGH